MTIDFQVGKKLAESGEALACADVCGRIDDLPLLIEVLYPFLLVPFRESFELLLKFGKSSFLRKQESSLFKTFWIPAYAGMTKWGYFSKLSQGR